MIFNKIVCTKERETVDRLIWDDNKHADLNEELIENTDCFDTIVQSLLNDETDLSTCIDKLSDKIYDISHQLHGKTFTVKKNKPTKKKSSWLGYCFYKPGMNIFMLNVKLKMRTILKKEIRYVI